MKEQICLELKVDGNDVQGSCEKGRREGMIECLFFDYGVEQPVTAAFEPRGSRQHEAVRVRKRVDNTTPLLMKALCKKEAVEARFLFFRPAITGSGQEEHFYTVTLIGGLIIGVHQAAEVALVLEPAYHPPVEEVVFSFKEISWTIEDGGIEWRDTVGRRV